MTRPKHVEQANVIDRRSQSPAYYKCQCMDTRGESCGIYELPEHLFWCETLSGWVYSHHGFWPNNAAMPPGTQSLRDWMASLP